MKKEKISLGYSLEEIKEFYDENLAVTFLVTQGKMIFTNAELVFLQRRVGIWKKEIDALDLKILSIELSSVDKHKAIKFKAELVANGGFHSEIKTTTLEVFKNILALEVLEQCSFLPEEKYYAKDVEISASFWQDNSDERRKELFLDTPRVREIFSTRKVKFVDISYHINRVIFTFMLEDDMGEDKLKKLIEELSFELNGRKTYSSPNIMDDKLYQQ